MNILEITSVYESRDASKFDEASLSLVSQARDLTPDKIGRLAEAIADSGDKIVLPSTSGAYGDVPSTGAPASLSTLLCPILIAACDVRVPKLSAPGSVAGGIDTLEIISGYRTELWGDEFLKVLMRVRYAHAKPSSSFCPADKSLIATRKKKNMMACAPLAAVSLISKKLAMPGTAAAFDFRVGPTGNIGKNEEEARKAARLFHQVARALNLKITIRLTDNLHFPCSALGRLESLRLLVDVLSYRELSQLDRTHLETCLDLSADAVGLARGMSHGEARSLAETSLHAGLARKLFIAHLEAQGASESSLNDALAAGGARVQKQLLAGREGFWTPPDLNLAKNWIKDAVVTMSTGRNSTEPGLRLRAEPFTKVARGQPLVEVSIPPQHSDALLPEFLMGSLSDSAPNTRIFRSYLVG